MGEWWTYSLSDFLMFSPRTYWRLIELHHRAVWPGQLLALGAGVGCLWLARSADVRRRGVGLWVLAAAWLWVGWAFHLQRYAAINWAAAYFAMAFGAQALLLAALAWRLATRATAEAAQAPTLLGGAGWLLAAAAVLLYPLAAPIAGRPLVQSDLFGMTPEPTALVTLGLLPSLGKGLSPRWLGLAAALPVLSLLIGAATLWTMAQ